MAQNLIGETTDKLYLSSIKLPNGNIVYIKDLEAWDKLQSIAGTVTAAMLYIGITTTELTDNSEIKVITIGEDTHTAKAGDVAIYGNLEFVYNGSKWQELGSSGTLKALAFKDKVTGDVELTGSAEAQVFTGLKETILVSLDNKKVTSTGKYTAAGSVTINQESAGEGKTANFTPEGTISAITVSLSKNTFDNLSVKSAGSVAPGTAATFDKVADEFVAPSLGATFVTAGSDGVAPKLDKTDVDFKGVKTVTSAAAGTAAAWNARMATDNSEMLVFDWTANVPTEAGSKVETENLSATKVDAWNAGTAAKATVVDTTLFNAGSYTEGKVTFNGGTPTSVTLPELKSTSVTYATDVDTVSTPQFLGIPTVIGATFAGSEQDVSVEGTTNVTAQEFTYTPKGTNAASDVVVTGSVTLS